eukprot:COSAG01_NODE_18_length_39884_cov_245.648184_19_plen_47_part_00
MPRMIASRMRPVSEFPDSGFVFESEGNSAQQNLFRVLSGVFRDESQ